MRIDNECTIFISHPWDKPSLLQRWSNNVWMDIQSKSKAFGEIVCMTIYIVNANAWKGNPIRCKQYVCLPCGSMSSSGTWTFQTLDFVSPYDPKLSAAPPDGDELTRRVCRCRGTCEKTAAVHGYVNSDWSCQQAGRVRTRNKAQPSAFFFFFFGQ